MSRTRKGSKAPGWEPWSNRHERQQPLIEPEQDEARLDHEDRMAEEMEAAHYCVLYERCDRCAAIEEETA